MYRTFNYGIGMVLVISPDEADDVIGRLAGLGEQAQIIGEITTADSASVQLI